MVSFPSAGILISFSSAATQSTIEEQEGGKTLDQTKFPFEFPRSLLFDSPLPLNPYLLGLIL